MTFSVRGSLFIPVLLAVIIAAVILGMRTRPGDTILKTVILTAIILFAALLSVFWSGPSVISVDSHGLRTTSFGKMDVNWLDVKTAVFTEDLKSSGFYPASRIKAVNAPDYYAGQATLRNGEKATVLLASGKQGIILETGRNVYVLSTENIRDVADEIKKYIEITGY